MHIGLRCVHELFFGVQESDFPIVIGKIDCLD